MPRQTSSKKPPAQSLPSVPEDLAKVRVPTVAVALFTRQLVALLTGGTELVKGLSTLTDQEDYPQLGAVLRAVVRNVETGHLLSQSLAQYPRVFPKLYVTLIQIAEKTGQLETCLSRLGGWLERDDALRRQITSALVYPAFVIALASVLTLVMVYTILPQFLDIFEELHVELPLITRIVVGLTKALQSPWTWLALVALCYGGYRLLKYLIATPERAVWLYSQALRIPILGGMLFHGTSARYCGSAEIMISSGLPTAQAFRLAAAASGSPLLLCDAPFLEEAITSGRPLSLHMRARPNIYSLTMVQMLVAGEESSCVAEMLSNAARFHACETQLMVDALGASLEPLLLAGVSLVVGTIIMAVFLPLYGIMSHL